MNGGESRVNSRHEHSYTTTNNYLLQINCSLTLSLSHTHTHLRTQKVEETMYGAKPHQHQSLHHTSRRGGGLQQEDRESRGGSIFQYSPVCSTGPRRYPTSSQRTQRRQMTPMSGTWDPAERRGRAVMKGCCEADGTQDELYVRYVSADSDDVFSRLVLRGKKI